MNAGDLIAWQRRLGLQDKQAAHLLRLSVSAYRRKRTGRQPIDDRTELLSAYVELVGGIDRLKHLAAAVDRVKAIAESMPPSIRASRLGGRARSIG